MNTLRTASLLALVSAAVLSQAVVLDDGFSVSDPGVTLTTPSSAASSPVSLGGGLTRSLFLTQLENNAPGVLDSSLFVSGNALSFNNGPLVRSNYSVNYTYGTAQSFVGTTSFQVDFRASDFAYELRAFLIDGSNRRTVFGALVPGGASPFSANLGLLGGDADLTDVRAIAIDSNAVPASTDSTITRIRSVQAVPEPATMAALGLGAMAMLRRRKRA